MNKKKISVIIPVFNVEKYLDRCVKSILNQSYKNYEVWLIDDGSTDRSAEMCDEYQKNHPNIYVIHKENRGLSHTRNVGVDNAAGEFVTYVDSDDYVTEDYLECLNEIIESSRADIACGGFEFFGGSEKIREVDNKDYLTRRYSGINACKALLYEKDFHTSSCNMLVKRSIAQKNLFPLGKYHEDEMTTFRYFLAAKQVAITDKVLYYYYQREGSIMHTFGQPVIDELFAANYYVDVCKDISRNLKKAATHKKFSLIMQTLTNHRDVKKVYNDLYKENIEYLKANSLGVLFDIHSSLEIRKNALLIFLNRAKL